MKNFKRLTLLFLFVALIFSQYAYGMKKTTKIKDKSRAEKVEVVTDSYVISDQILPFAELKQSELMQLRLAGKTMKQGIMYHSENKPITLKPIYPKNIKTFLNWLIKNHHGIDYFVHVQINGKNPESKNLLKALDNKEISDKDFKEVFKLIGNKTRELTLSGFDTKKIDLTELSKYDIKKLNLYEITGNINSLLKKLPIKLEELGMMCCYDNITKEIIQHIPKTLKTLKIMTLEAIELDLIKDEKLDIFPKNIKSIYLLEDFSTENLHNKNFQKKVLMLKKNGVKVLNNFEMEYPTNDQEAEKGLLEYKKMIHKNIDNISKLRNNFIKKFEHNKSS